jgi:hypothetical protein
MPHQVSLAVTVEVEPARHPPALNGRLPDGGINGFPLPLDVTWQANIYQKQTGHRFHLHAGRSVSAFHPVSIVPTAISNIQAAMHAILMH